MELHVLNVTEAINLVNVSIAENLGALDVEGEISNYQIRGNSVYFNLKDENSSIRVYSPIWKIKAVLEDGMKVKINGIFRLHNTYGISLNVNFLELSGEGTIKKAFLLLKNKLEKEGLFNPFRKRQLPKYPNRIGIISSPDAAGYKDFIKIINARTSGLEILFYPTKVQGVDAGIQIIEGIDFFNSQEKPVEVLVIIRGGGDRWTDLITFDEEPLARAIARSRIITLVGVGHEQDETIADLVCDVRASTPSNAAELLITDKKDIINECSLRVDTIKHRLQSMIENKIILLDSNVNFLKEKINNMIDSKIDDINLNMENVKDKINNEINLLIEKNNSKISILEELNPKKILKKGYAVIRDKNNKKKQTFEKDDEIIVETHSNSLECKVINIIKKNK